LPGEDPARNLTQPFLLLRRREAEVDGIKAFRLDRQFRRKLAAIFGLPRQQSRKKESNERQFHNFMVIGHHERISGPIETSNPPTRNPIAGSYPRSP
jgi:hypothetical protein